MGLLPGAPDEDVDNVMLRQTSFEATNDSGGLGDGAVVCGSRVDQLKEAARGVAVTGMSLKEETSLHDTQFSSEYNSLEHNLYVSPRGSLVDRVKVGPAVSREDSAGSGMSLHNTKESFDSFDHRSSCDLTGVPRRLGHKAVEVKGFRFL